MSRRSFIFRRYLFCIALLVSVCDHAAREALLLSEALELFIAALPSSELDQNALVALPSSDSLYALFVALPFSELV